MNSDEREAQFQRYEAGPALLEAALNRAPGASRHWKGAPDQWSVHEIVLHCADSETNSAMRIRYLVGETTPTIAGYDQDRWAREMKYDSLPLDLSLRQIISVRAWTAAFIRSLPEAAWSRVGRHTEHAQPYSSEQWLLIYAEHLEIHARQIARTVDAWRAAGTTESH